MHKEPLVELLTFSLTEREKTMLSEMAYQSGGTMSGYLRKLIREAAERSGYAGANNLVGRTGHAATAR